MTAPVRHVWAALLVVWVVWGSTYLGIKIVVETLPPLFSAGSRFFAAALILGSVLALRGTSLRITPRELGGMGLSRLAMAVMYQEANRSIFGPVVFNAAAPDDGNMMLLAKVATPAQQARWLRPIVEGRARPAFAMTEPMPGGGSDPSMIRTRARRRDGGWVVEGRK